MEKYKRVEIKMLTKEYLVLVEAMKKAKNESHRKDYGLGTYLKESGLNRAKRLS